MDADRQVERVALTRKREEAYLAALTAFDRLRTADLESGEAERQLREADWHLRAHEILYGMGEDEPTGLLNMQHRARQASVNDIETKKT